MRFLRRDCDAQRILGLLVTEAAPRRRVLREDERPLRLAGQHVQAVLACGERLALDLHGVRDAEHRVLVRAGAPRALAAGEAEIVHAVRHQLAPDLAASILAAGTVHVRAAVRDAHADEADLLRDLRALVVAIRRERDRLRGGAAGAREDEDENDVRDPCHVRAPPRGRRVAPHGARRIAAVTSGRGAGAGRLRPDVNETRRARYSCRSAPAGSTEATRRAGNAHATRATAMTSAATTA